MTNLMLKLLFCHLFGDYVLQPPYLAETKGQNGYHIFVHCTLYTVLSSLIFLLWSGMGAGSCVLFAPVH